MFKIFHEIYPWDELSINPENAKVYLSKLEIIDKC